MLEGGAALRGAKKNPVRSLLAGKLFDETSDWLAPSQTKKNGSRLRHYSSRKPATARGEKHPDAW